MKRTDFYIGRKFTMSGKSYQCTDVGTRVIVAIQLEEDLDSSWFLNGPPYAVQEIVIDENDMTACKIS